MITEDYVSFEVAKLLKEKGFDKFNTYGWDEELFDKEHPRNFSLGFDSKEHWISAPTHQMAMKWLRERGFHINVVISYDYSVDADGNEVDRWVFWFFEILSSFGGNLIYTEEVNEYDSYEQACEAGLKYVLKNLI